MIGSYVGFDSIASLHVGGLRVYTDNQLQAFAPAAAPVMMLKTLDLDQAGKTSVVVVICEEGSDLPRLRAGNRK